MKFLNINFFSNFNEKGSTATPEESQQAMATLRSRGCVITPMANNAHKK